MRGSASASVAKKMIDLTTAVRRLVLLSILHVCEFMNMRFEWVG